jgi:N-glycosidase YbiA
VRESDTPIYFYTKTGEYFELSNFAPFGFEEGGVYWPTVEHYFHAQKFPDAAASAYRERIRCAATAKDAKNLGRTREIPIRADWDQVKDDVMLHALRRKFAIPRLRELLLATGERPLVEASPFDDYWGAGSAGNGRNRLGELLAQVRAELRSR